MISRMRQALEYAGATHTVEDVLHSVEMGEAMLWHSDGGILVTEVYEYPLKKVLHCWLAAGELEAVIDLSRQALEWAKEQGCTTATLTGRKGWLRVLGAEGWRATPLVMMEREVN